MKLCLAKNRADKKKKDLYPIHMGQKPFTSAIPPKLTFLKTPARLRAPSYAPRWITGGIPVGLYLAFAVRSALRSPFTSRPLPRSHHPGLSLCLSAPVTSLRHRFEALHLLVCIIRTRTPFVKRAARKKRNFIRETFVENAHFERREPPRRLPLRFTPAESVRYSRSRRPPFSSETSGIRATSPR